VQFSREVRWACGCYRETFEVGCEKKIEGDLRSTFLWGWFLHEAVEAGWTRLSGQGGRNWIDAPRLNPAYKVLMLVRQLMLTSILID
jgi:hypothetical protein